MTAVPCWVLGGSRLLAFAAVPLGEQRSSWLRSRVLSEAVKARVADAMTPEEEHGGEVMFDR